MGNPKASHFMDWILLVCGGFLSSASEERPKQKTKPNKAIERPSKFNYFLMTLLTSLFKILIY